MLKCMTDDNELELGRAYHYNAEAMNKKFPVEEVLSKLLLLSTKINISKKQIELYGEEHYDGTYDEIIEFLKTHRKHDVWLINDFFGEEKKDVVV